MQILDRTEELFVACVLMWLEYIGDVTDYATGRTVPETLCADEDR